ncbi:39 kDa FK506-binding nuclear protein [Drosophila sulfurigaster albostrigata]|uniref:39 kDa FK506-binding nuclear protein n=1 Tax=Drosophila sulfurigaster albostrigata TaxID=89887 RepID=UPI002D21D8CB|nr:39 kDa FK506-binding nuclear protein [Drosophila sulfurigaster albostrigata]
MSMFWGLSMKPNRKYTQTIVKSFHISGAALEEGDLAKLYITADKNKFIVATLSKNIPQIALDLNFCKGDKIMFQTTGNASVSLIGYLHDAEESDDEDFEDDEYAALAEGLEKGEGAENESDSEEGSDDEEDEDDSKLAAEYSSFLEDNESGEEEESDDDDEEEEEEDEESDEEDTPKAKKAKIAESAKKPAKAQNGVAKADKKQQQQQQQQQQKSKKDKKAAGEDKKEQPKGKEGKQQQQQQSGGERTIAGGVKVQDLNAGNGPEAKQGKRVSVYYIGRLKSNNKTFDSMQKGNGFKFALGGGEVIKGWDVGVAGMKVGGKRRITCPAHMAYGARGHPPTIPPNSTLVFDVELKAVH